MAENITNISKIAGVESKLNSADTAWVLASTCLVFIMVK
jgi:hypothetical protein